MKTNLTDEAVTMYKSGSTLSAVATRFGCSVSTVSKFLKSREVEMRPRGRRKKVVNTPSLDSNSSVA